MFITLVIIPAFVTFLAFYKIFNGEVCEVSIVEICHFCGKANHH